LKPKLDHFLLTHYQRALDRCQPYLLATEQVKPLLEMSPLGVNIQECGLVLDPQARKNEPFLHLLQQLDRLTFGPLEMAMPKWVFYDAGVMPSAVFGFCGPSSTLEPWVHRALGVPEGYSGLVPLTIFIAIPTTEDGTWFTHTLTSLNQVCMGTAAPAGLTMLSICLGTRVLKVRNLYGTTQWRSHRLDTLTALGPLDLATAYTPNHSVRRTFTWRLAIERPLIEAALLSSGVSAAARPATHILDVDDDDALISLQHEIEAGVRVQIVGPTLVRGSLVQCPIRKEALP
jgi:hypothetical protein